jgi:hypothetical protein
MGNDLAYIHADQSLCLCLLGIDVSFILCNINIRMHYGLCYNCLP